MRAFVFRQRFFFLSLIVTRVRLHFGMCRHTGAAFVFTCARIHADICKNEKWRDRWIERWTHRRRDCWCSSHLVAHLVSHWQRRNNRIQQFVVCFFFSYIPSLFTFSRFSVGLRCLACTPTPRRSKREWVHTRERTHNDRTTLDSEALWLCLSFHSLARHRSNERCQI